MEELGKQLREHDRECDTCSEALARKFELTPDQILCNRCYTGKVLHSQLQTELNKKDLNELANKLNYYGRIEGSECGEYWLRLAVLPIDTDMMDEEFQKAVRKEIQAQLMHIFEEFEIEYKELVQTTKYQELKHISEQ